MVFPLYRYCQEFFTEEFNQHCKYAPDCFRNVLEYTTAMKCARCMMYHCDISDPEGEMPQHPCQCIPGESWFSKRFVIERVLIVVKWRATNLIWEPSAPIRLSFEYRLIILFVPFFCCSNPDGSACVDFHYSYHAYVYIRRVMDVIGSEYGVVFAAKSIRHKFGN